MSQTPLIIFRKRTGYQYYKVDDEPTDLSALKEGIDYYFSPGGVTRMLFPLLKRLLQEGVVDAVNWISLNPAAPMSVVHGDLVLNHVRLEEAKMKGYGSAKERIWRAVHGVAKEKKMDFFWEDDYIDYTYLNRRFSELAIGLDRSVDFDLFYVHDFQLLPQGTMLPPGKPKVFRWHIPFDEDDLPYEWRTTFLRFLSSYDTIVLSSKRYSDSLRRLGYTGEAVYVYPYLDIKHYDSPEKGTVDLFCSLFNLSNDDRVILVVGRMDPIKGQDVVIKAFKKVIREEPKAKLLIVGDGSFTSAQTGVGLPKSERWTQHLKDMVKKAQLEDRVIFSGHIEDQMLKAAYTRSDVCVLSSIKEGFGLVVIEAWIYGKPVLVSSSAGVADLIRDGVNGILFDPYDHEALAKKLVLILKDRGLADRLGREGQATATLCSLDEGIKREVDILHRFIGG
jgi:glycosyltransferase involved in cell wall biosynthesis